MASWSTSPDLLKSQFHCSGGELENWCSTPSTTAPTCRPESLPSISQSNDLSDVSASVQRPASVAGMVCRSPITVGARPNSAVLRYAEPSSQSGLGKPSPQPRRPSSGMQQPFVRETLIKLSQDSLRTPDERSLAASPTPSLPSGARRPLEWQTHGIELDLESARAAFREEAQTLLDSCDSSKCILGWSKQFVEWHRKNAQVAARVEEQVEDLFRLNESLLQDLQEHVMTDDFRQFKLSMNSWTQAMNNLLEPGDQGSASLVESIEKAVGNSVEKATRSINAELASASKVWHDLADRQTQRWVGSDALRGELDERLQRLEDSIIRVADEVACQDAKMQDRFEEVLGQVTGRTEATMRWATRDLEESIERATEKMVASLKNTSSDANSALKQHFNRLIVGKDDMVPAPSETESQQGEEYVNGLLHKFDARLDDGVCSHQQAELWREAAEAMKQERGNIVQEVEQAKLQNDELRGNMKELEEQIVDLERDLGEAQKALLTPATWSSLKDKVDEVQSGGNLKIDLQTGEIDILSGITFAPCKPTEPPVAKVMDETAAQKALMDVAAVLTMFAGVPMSIESHMKPAKGPAAFYDQLTVNRAEFVKVSLEKLGVNVASIVTKGLPGNKGLNKPWLRIKPGIFPEAPAPQQAATGKRR